MTERYLKQVVESLSRALMPTHRHTGLREELRIQESTSSCSARCEMVIYPAELFMPCFRCKL